MAMGAASGKTGPTTARVLDATSPLFGASAYWLEEGIKLITTNTSRSPKIARARILIYVCAPVYHLAFICSSIANFRCLATHNPALGAGLCVA